MKVAASPGLEDLSIATTRLIVLSQLAVMVPHLSRLPAWISVVFVLGMALGWFKPKVIDSPVVRALKIVLTLGAFIGIVQSYGTFFGRQPGLALLAVMLGLKMLECRTRRDGLILIFLAYFAVITNFLFSQSLLISAYMATTVVLITGSLIALHDVYWQKYPLKVGQRALIIVGQAVPIAVVLFVLFPRLEGALWSLGPDSYSATTGLSATLNPGDISDLVQSDEVAFRVHFDGPLPPPAQRYFRAVVLADFEGRTWRPAKLPAIIASWDSSPGPAISYQITMAPNQKNWMFALERPGPQVPLNTRLTTENLWRNKKPITELLHYKGIAYPEAQVKVRPAQWLLQRNLLLPDNTNPKSRAFAQALRATVANDQAFINKLLKKINQETFYYSLHPPRLGAHIIDDFWFGERTGFCGHFAGSFAFMLRSAGIPTRVVLGYQGGEFNQLGNYLIVHQYDAHAWVEAWLPATGWTRFDPTAAINPARIRLDDDLRRAFQSTVFGGILPRLGRAEGQWLKQVRLTADWLSNGWDQMVVAYDSHAQRSFLQALGMKNTNASSLGLTIVFLLVGILSLYMLLMLRARPRVETDPVLLVYEKFLNKLEQINLKKSAYEGPLDYGCRIGKLRPDLGNEVGLISRCYIKLRYGSTLSKHRLKVLRRLVMQFKPGKLEVLPLAKKSVHPDKAIQTHT